MLMAIQLNLAGGLLPPTLLPGAVFTTLETIGVIMMWSGVAKMVDSGRYAARSTDERAHRHAVRDLIVAPTFRHDGAGLALAGRF